MGGIDMNEIEKIFGPDRAEEIKKQMYEGFKRSLMSESGQKLLKKYSTTEGDTKVTFNILPQMWESYKKAFINGLMMTQKAMEENADPHDYMLEQIAKELTDEPDEKLLKALDDVIFGEEE